MTAENLSLEAKVGAAEAATKIAENLAEELTAKLATRKEEKRELKDRLDRLEAKVQDFSFSFLLCLRRSTAGGKGALEYRLPPKWRLVPFPSSRT